MFPELLVKWERLILRAQNSEMQFIHFDNKVSLRIERSNSFNSTALFSLLLTEKGHQYSSVAMNTTNAQNDRVQKFHPGQYIYF